MLAYLFLLSIPSLFALVFPSKRHVNLLLLFLFLVYILFIGFRYETGSDWPAYQKMFDVMSELTLVDSLFYTEPGYAALNWFLAKQGLTLLSVNVVVAIIFITGLVRFAKIMPNPSLALVSVTPYLIIVIGMSATRQSAAIGFVFLVLANWNKSSLSKISYSLLAISFHYSAVVVLFFVLYNMKIRAWMKWVILIVGSVVSLYVLKDTSKIMEYNQTYRVANIVSPGAIQHAMLNVMPAIIYLLFRKRWHRIYGNVDLINILAIASFISMALVFVSSTAIDRLALYLSPIQMFVYSSFPVVFKKQLYAIGIIIMHFLILYLWLGYSNTAHAFLPYTNWLQL